MPHGLQTLDASGNVLLDVSSRVARVVDTQTVTVPSIGVTNTYSIPADCTPSNSTPVLDNGSYAVVSSAGVAQVLGSQALGTTIMRIYRHA